MYIFGENDKIGDVIAWADANPDIVRSFIAEYKNKLIKTAYNSYIGKVNFFDIGVSKDYVPENDCIVFRVPVHEAYEVLGDLTSVKRSGNYGVKVNIRGNKKIYHRLCDYPVVGSFTWNDVYRICDEYGFPENAGVAWEILYKGYSDKSGGLVDYVDNGSKIQAKISMTKRYDYGPSAGEADLLTFPICKILNDEPYVITWDNKQENVIGFDLHRTSKKVELKQTRRFIDTAFQLYFKKVEG